MSSPAPSATRQPIALFVNSFGGGGAEKNTVMIANGMIAQGHEVDVIVERDVGSYRGMLSPRAQVVDLGSTSPFVILQKLCQYFRKTPPRVIITHLEKPSLLSLVAGLLTGYRKVIPVLHVDLDSYAKIDHAARRKFLRLLLGIFYRLAPRIISVSNGCKDSLAPLVGAKCAERIVTVYNGEQRAGRAPAAGGQGQADVHLRGAAGGPEEFRAADTRFRRGAAEA